MQSQHVAADNNLILHKDMEYSCHLDILRISKRFCKFVMSSKPLVPVSLVNSSNSAQEVVIHYLQLQLLRM